MLTMNQAARLTATFILCSASLVFAVDQPKLDQSKDVPTWVQAKVTALEPTAADRKFDEIGWAKGIVDAEQLAKKNNRPVFLFTQNGRIEIGRT